MERIACTLDRITDFQRDYEAAEDVKLRVQIGTEMRLHDSALTRLLKLISTDAPAEAVPESRATLRARRAANLRWHPPGINHAG